MVLNDRMEHNRVFSSRVCFYVNISCSVLFSHNTLCITVYVNCSVYIAFFPWKQFQALSLWQLTVDSYLYRVKLALLNIEIVYVSHSLRDAFAKKMMFPHNQCSCRRKTRLLKPLPVAFLVRRCSLRGNRHLDAALPWFLISHNTYN